VRIIGLVEDPEHVCCRYRLRAFQAHLEAAGHELKVRSIPRHGWSRLRLWRSLRQADVVILQRRLLSWVHLLLVRRYAKRLIFDFDDAIFHRDSFSTKEGESSCRMRRFIRTVHAADALVVGNAYLQRETARFANVSRIHVVPTCVDPGAYPLAAHQRGGQGVRLVWIGSSSTLQGLERQGPLMSAVARQVPGIECKVICDRFPHFEGMPLVRTRWSQESEARELASADIGISWIPDDPWSKGKCGLKVLQYMAAGLPVVANPVGMHEALVRPGETGYLAQTSAEWIEAIRHLAADPGLRRRLGGAGRRIVERHYGVDQGAELWLRLLGSFGQTRQLAAA
jgi:glycosyltransferase involved in cell wall biosynthesis